MSPLNNPYKPSTGEPIIQPRHELLYGLYICTKVWDKAGEHHNIGSLDELKTLALKHQIKVYDTAAVPGIGTDTVGRHLMRWCLDKRVWKHLDQDGAPLVITNKTVGKIIRPLLDTKLERGSNKKNKSERVFEQGINRMGEVGFGIATLYTPTVNVLGGYDRKQLRRPFEAFHKTMSRAVELYDAGFMDDQEYLAKLGKTISDTSKEVETSIRNGAVDRSDAFVLFAESGARGSYNNLLQIYSHIGMTKKSAYEQFPIIIEHSYMDGLTPTEHFMAAFGARADTMARTSKTADMGYTSRLMEHTAIEVIIRQNDCLTTDGIMLRREDIAKHLRGQDEGKILAAKIDRHLGEIIVGRYLADPKVIKEYDRSGTGYISQQLAEILIDAKIDIKLRSVLMCKISCCAKCYGEDIAHKSRAVVGHAVGVVAAQAIGELGTQLSMDTFQQGGVMTEKDIASDFDRVKAFLNMQDISKNDRFPLYDPIAWHTGKVSVSTISNTQRTVRIAGSNKEIRMPIDIELKEEAVKGEPMSVRLGDCDVNEILIYKSLEEAQLYLALAMYITYRAKEEINFKHFECLAAGMTLHMVLDRGKRQDLREGKFYTTRQLYEGSTESVKIRSMLKDIHKIPLLRNSLLSNIDMERVLEGLSKALLTGAQEDFSGAIEAMLIGMKPKLGTYYENYLHDREVAPYDTM
jgi:DNA-directed RNA polymerase subunit beta'